MIHTICEKIKFRNVVVTQVGGYRMVPAGVLQDIFRKEGYEEVQAFEEIPEAFEYAHTVKGEDGLLFCVGSLYLVGEIKSFVRERNGR